jgi:hypothetical protein
MVNGLGQSQFEDLGLQASLQEVLDLEAEDVIQTGLGLVQDAGSDETTNEGIALKQTLGVFFVQSQELTGSSSDVGEGVPDSPNLSLVSEAVLASELELGIQTFSDKRTTGDLGGL